MNRRTVVWVFAAIVALAFPARARQGGGIYLPGTQPGAVLITPASMCGFCHAGYSNGLVEPGDTWEGTMHQNSARSPAFRAALAVANQDVAGSGEWCMRCHVPSGWLEGRANPPNGSALLPDDLDSVQCDVCHRMVDPLTPEGQGMVSPPVNWYGNAMFVVDPGSPPTEPPKRGPYANSFSPFHGSIDSPFHRSGEICGSCHDVSNPLFPDPADPYNPQKGHILHRTFSEWKASDFYAMGEAGNCQSCHMKHVQDDYACALGLAPLRTFLPTHDFTGGNAWMPDVIPLVWGIANTAPYQKVKQRAIQSLQSAARLRVTTRTFYGVGIATVRVRNETGHKLPTGTPEGHRMWIRLRGYDASGAVVFESGAYDPATAILAPDAQLKVYEMLQGQPVGGVCQPNPHSLFNTCVVKENRIPPRGFTNAAFAVFHGEPVGASYRDGQFWDDTVYVLPGNVATAEAGLYYQTASREYVEYLKNENTTDNWGNTLWNAWLATGKSPPVLMESFTSPVGPFVEAGAGSAGSGGFVPRLSGGGSPVPGGSISLLAADGVGGGWGLLLFGWSPLLLPMSCGTIYASPQIALPVQLEGISGTPGGGATEVDIAVPGDPALSGLVTYVQAGFVDPGVPPFCSLSNGLVVTLQ